MWEVMGTGCLTKLHTCAGTTPTHTHITLTLEKHVEQAPVCLSSQYLEAEAGRLWI